MPFCAKIPAKSIEYKTAKFFLKNDKVGNEFNVTFYRDEMIDISDIIVSVRFYRNEQTVDIVSQNFGADVDPIIPKTSFKFKLTSDAPENEPMIIMWFESNASNPLISIVSMIKIYEIFSQFGSGLRTIHSCSVVKTMFFTDTLKSFRKFSKFST